MRIWVTRSEPGASSLADALATEGHSVLKAPVVAIRGLEFILPVLHFELGVFLSVHGVQHGGASLVGLVDQTFAVGIQTQRALERLGVASQTPSQASSEGLVKALGDVAGRTVLIVSGRGGRDVLQSELASRGASVERLDVYERAPLTPVGLVAGSIDAIVVSSGDGFEYAVQVWFAAGGSRDVPVLVPSSRVAAFAPKLGMRNIHNCRGADSDAVLDGLRQLVEE